MSGLLEKIIHFVKYCYLEIIVLSLFVVDACSFYVDRCIGLAEEDRFSFVFRAIVEVILILIICFKRLYNRYILCMFALVSFPLIWLLLASFFNGEYSYNTFNTFQIIKESNKYIFPVIVYWGFSVSVSRYKLLIFELIYILSAVVVIFAFLLDIPLFYTYGLSRFGYKPMILAHNEITLFWMVGIIYYLKKVFETYSLLNLICCIIVTLGAFLLGTKGMLLFLLVLSFWLIIFINRMSVLKKMFIIGFILVLCCLFFMYSGIFDFFNGIYKTDGFLYSLSSMRTELVSARVIPTIYNWRWYNYLIGGYFLKLPIAEMDLIDLFVFYGAIGFILYFILMFKTIFSFNKSNYLAWFFVIMYVVIGGMAGHFFTSGTNAVYLAVLCSFLQKDKEILNIK